MTIEPRLTQDTDKGMLRALVRTFYDTQKLRIEVGNRLVANFRAQLGQDPGMGTDELSTEAQDIIDTLKKEYRLMADSLARCNLGKWRSLLEENRGLLSSPYDVILTENYLALEQTENRLSREIAAVVEDFAIWDTFLKDVRGCGPLMGAVIISELDPYKARHPSSFWMFSGLDVAEDGKGRSRRSEHLVTRTYTTADGTEAERLSITFNPFLKTKLVGVLGTSFLRSGGYYRTIYDGYKNRLENRPDAANRSKLHTHRMAIRYAVKIFLLDCWKAWRSIEGLPVGEDYATAKLGLVHGQSS